MKAKKVTEEQVHVAFRTILDNQKNKSLNYAINYALAGLNITGKELYVQTLYVLNNINNWRGEEAKVVRETLKQFVKENR